MSERAAKSRKRLKTTPMTAWVIPNGIPGQLWTLDVFASEQQAREHWTAFWGEPTRDMPSTHHPVRAQVQLIAEPDKDPAP